jgi:very-short-patch-repair endonuclease
MFVMKYYEVKKFSRRLRKKQTESEQTLWQLLRDRQLEGFKFLRQHPLLYDRQGNNLRFFIPDFYCPRARLIVELDGSVHDATKDYDRWRDEILTEKGLKVLRFRNDELTNIDAVLQRIRAELKG